MSTNEVGVHCRHCPDLIKPCNCSRVLGPHWADTAFGTSWCRPGQPHEPAAPEIRVLAWDHRQQPDLEELRLALAEHGVYLREATTGDDQYAVAISGTPITQAEADDSYRRVFQ
jgi:hypothetical protein